MLGSVSRDACEAAFENETKYLLVSFEGKKFLVSFSHIRKDLLRTVFSCGGYIPNVSARKLKSWRKGDSTSHCTGKKREYKGTPEISEEMLGGRRVAFKQLTRVNTVYMVTQQGVHKHTALANSFWNSAYLHWSLFIKHITTSLLTRWLALIYQISCSWTLSRYYVVVF